MAIALTELPPNDWSALLLTDRFDLATGRAGLGYVAVAGGMLVGRLVGDLVTDRMGLDRTRRAGAALAAAGVVLAATLPSAVAAGAGLFVAGLGLSSLFPLRVPGRRELTHGSHSGMASFSSGARLGFLLASPLMGFIAGASSIAVAMVIVAGGAGLAVAIARLPRPALAELEPQRAIVRPGGGAAVGSRRRDSGSASTVTPPPYRPPHRHPPHPPTPPGEDPCPASAAPIGCPARSSTRSTPSAPRSPSSTSPCGARSATRPSPSSSTTTGGAAPSSSSTAPTSPTPCSTSSSWSADSIAERGRGGCMVVATVRPGGGPEPGDEDRWLEASDLADELGVELVEWFVIGGDRPSVAANAVCPRDLLGEVPRWSTW